MFCQYCGCKLPESAKFCPECGQPVGEVKQEQYAQPLSKVFHFGLMSRNEAVIQEVNAWLAEQRIRLKGIRITTFLNQNIPLKFELVPYRLELVYVEDANEPVYQMDYFKQMQLFSLSTEKLENTLNLWKRDNPNCRVVYHELRTCAVSGGGVATLFFIYQ